MLDAVVMVKYNCHHRKTSLMHHLTEMHYASVPLATKAKMLLFPVHPLMAIDDADEDDGVGESGQHASMHVDAVNDDDNET